MKKIVPLISLIELDNYQSNGVDAILMGTVFSSQAQMRIYDIQEIIDANEKIPVIALFNRDFTQNENPRVMHEIKALYEGGINHILIQDEALLHTLEDSDFDLEITFLLHEVIEKERMEHLMKKGVHEFLMNTDVKQASMARLKSLNIGLHFFGNRLLHSQKEGQEEAFVLRDAHGFHTFAQELTSKIAMYDTIKENKIISLYFEPFSTNIEDILFVVRNLDLLDDYQQFDAIVKETMEKESCDEHA